jgi:hypothetical protein
MLEVTIWSLLVGNIGWQAMVVSGWLRRRQIVSSQQHQEEEEILTRFESKEDFASVESLQRNGNVDSHNRANQVSTDPQMVGWEFKIVRANRDLFRNPAVLQKLCQEEAIAGWILLEKLDDRRVRFKRLIALRNILDANQLTYDPYRCHYGSSFTPLTWLSAIAALTMIALPCYFGYTLVAKMLIQSKTQPTPSLPKEKLPPSFEEIPPQSFPPVKTKPTNAR